MCVAKLVVQTCIEVLQFVECSANRELVENEYPSYFWHKYYIWQMYFKGLPLLSSEASYTWIAINPQFKPWGFINFMVYIHPGSNRD